MDESKWAGARSWLELVLLVAALAGLLFLSDVVDRLSSPPIVTGDTGLRGWRRDVIASVGALPAELGGPRQPSFHPQPGVYDRSLAVELHPNDPQAVVIFTTDGSLPTLQHGAVYQRPLHLDVQQPGVTVIRAIQVSDGLPGPEVVAIYAVGLDSQVPVLSLVAQPDDLWGAEQGLLSNPSFRGADWERPVLVSLLDGRAGFSVPAGLRIHGTEPLTAQKQSLRLYFRGEYGAARLDYPLFVDHPEQPESGQSYDRLLLQAGDRNGWWTLFRDDLVAETAGSLGLRTAQGRFVHLFLNGRSWGLYRLSERVDRSFLGDAFGYRGADVVQEGAARDGSDEDWDALVDFAVANDLTSADAFSHIDDRLDVQNFIDFAALQLYFGFAADDLYAVRDRGDRWTFVYAGGAQTFAQRPDEVPPALVLEDTDFALLLRAMMANADFRQQLQVRTANLLNTVLAPDTMSERVKVLAEHLTADILYESARWPTPTDWADNVALLETFVAARPASLRSALADMLALSPPVTVQVRSDPPGGGRVFVGGLPLPGSGDFFSDTIVQFTAVPTPGYTFDGWLGVPAPSVSPTLVWTVDGAQALVATFRPIAPDDQGHYPNDVIINEFWINDNGTPYRSLEGRPLTGDWVELLVQRPATVDLRGWRLTDNNTRSGTDEGSLSFPHQEAFAAVPRGTVILIIATQHQENSAHFPTDDLDAADRRMILYVENGNLDAASDPGFAIGTRNDNLVLMAPRRSASGAAVDEVGIDFVAEGTTVTPHSFGVLADGVVFESPFRHLGGDDGAAFTGAGANDHGTGNWTVDPPACASGDAQCLDSVNVLSPGSLTIRQSLQLWWARISE